MQTAPSVPGVNVEMKNLETNLVRTVTTNEDGRYVVLALPPGNYSVTASKQGFTTTFIENTPLTVGQTLTANFSLRSPTLRQKLTSQVFQPSTR